MNILSIEFWLWFGVICVVAEFIVPGLVTMFIGLGAFTVALGMHLNYLEGLPAQLSTFFASSIIYIFTLRVLIIHLLPSDSVKENINQDDEVIGSKAEVVETIEVGGFGRVSCGDSTWQAKSNSNEVILKGVQVKIIGRDNITWLVEKV